MHIVNSNLRFSSQYLAQEQKRTQYNTPSTQQQAPLQATTQPQFAINSTQHTELYTRSSIRHASAPQTTTLTTQHNKNSQLSHLLQSNTQQTNVLQANTTPPSSSSELQRFQSAQQLQFSLAGSVETLSGSRINFDLKINTADTLQIETRTGVFVQAAQQLDPLVINFDGHYNNLSQQAYQFDLDGDGKQEYISFTGAGSAFLALDKNQDGIINNGSELFGTQSGNGFADLQQFDDDDNGFIDHNDRVFSQLKLYSKDQNGNDVLHSLQSSGIAALSLEHAKTPFSIRNRFGDELGTAQKTGFYITESGSVGTVQQIDLSIRSLDTEFSMMSRFPGLNASEASMNTSSEPAQPTDTTNLLKSGLMQFAKIQSTQTTHLSDAEALPEDSLKTHKFILMEQIILSFHAQIKEQVQNP